MAESPRRSISVSLSSCAVSVAWQAWAPYDWYLPRPLLSNATPVIVTPVLSRSSSHSRITLFDYIAHPVSIRPYICVCVCVYVQSCLCACRDGSIDMTIMKIENKGTFASTYMQRRSTANSDLLLWNDCSSIKRRDLSQSHDVMLQE